VFHEHRHLLDWLTWACALTAGISLANAALMVTFVAGLLSIILGAIRLHDRLKYGPARKD
jgi:hypothetical protein